MPWYVTNRPRLALRVANFIESRFPDAEECTQVGDGVHETRVEYRRRYRARVFVRPHPDGVRWAIFMSLAAKTRFDAWREQIRAKRAAGTADPDEVEVDEQIPADVASLDPSWEATAQQIQ